MNQHYFQRLSSVSSAGRSKTTKDETPPCVEYSSSVTMTLCPGVQEPSEVIQAKEEFEAAVDMKRISRELEDYIRTRKVALEEKMFEKFYLMRIEQSRKFIDLIRKINKSWDDFIEYLKTIGSQGASGDGDCTVYSLTNSSSLTGASQASSRSKRE